MLGTETHTLRHLYIASLLVAQLKTPSNFVKRRKGRRRELKKTKNKIKYVM